jgi:uncharacterized protein YjiS (DUF1127 family)
MDRSLHTPLPCRPRLAAWRLVRRLFAAWGRSLERARTRRLLAQLNEQQLSDIGISHCERMAELERSFWQ